MLKRQLKKYLRLYQNYNNEKINHFLNINELKKSEVFAIVKNSHILKKNYGKKKLKKKNFRNDF